MVLPAAPLWLALYEPDIAQNTGAMLRTCACLGVRAAIIEPAVLIATAWRVRLGLGVTQQHQTAHGILESFHVQNNLQAPVEDKVTSARLVL